MQRAARFGQPELIPSRVRMPTRDGKVPGMTTSVAHAHRIPARTPRSGSVFRPALVALAVAVAVLVGWTGPLGAQAAPVRPASTTVSGVNAGQAPTAVARAARATVAGATARGAQQSIALQRTVGDGLGGAPVLPLAAALLATALLLGSRRHLSAVPRRAHGAARSATGSHHRDRAPPAPLPATA